MGGGSPDHLFQFESSLGVSGPAYAEYQFLMKGFGYGVYKEGFDIVFHYDVRARFSIHVHGAYTYLGGRGRPDVDVLIVAVHPLEANRRASIDHKIHLLDLRMLPLRLLSNKGIFL